MENIKDFLGCRCHGGLHFQSPTQGHTFSLAKPQYNRDRPVRPTSQFLDLNLDIESQTLSGTNTISFKVFQKSVENFFVDSIDLKIQEVLMGGKPVSYSVEQKGIIVTCGQPLQRDEVGELKIKFFSKNPRAGLYFIKPDPQYPQRPVQVWTQGQDDDSRYWFPCFDEPNLKAAFEMKVQVPAGFIATSNGALIGESRTGNKWTFHWKTPVAIPSYLVTLTAGQFSEIKDQWRGKPVVYLCQKGKEEEAKISFGKTPKMMEFFSKTIGVNYPYEKYTQVAVAEFIFGGMENTSATTQTDSTLHPKDIDFDFTSDDLVSHELAHQWFGDLVTCKSWAHGWLNEGWATFMESVFKESDLGIWESEYYRYLELGIYLDEDSRVYRRPIVSNYYSDPAEIWDRHLYQKGGLVLNLLRHELGAEDFWNGTKKYLEDHRGGPVETVDFQRSLEEISGKNLQRFFDQWLFKAGYPELKVALDWDDKTGIAKLIVEQKQKTDSQTPLFHLKIPVDFIFSDGPIKSEVIEIKSQKEVFSFSLKVKPLYCRFDPNSHHIKTLEWNAPLEMTKNQLDKDNDVVAKIWTMRSMIKDASLQAVETVAERLQKDEFWGVRAEAAVALGESKSTDAMSTLVNALGVEKNSKVRTKICSALGEFREDAAASALVEALGKDSSTFVRGAAAAALGKTKSPKAFESLKESLKRTSWNDFVAAQSFSGLRALRDERAIPLFLEGAKYGAPKFARINAVSALGEFGRSREDITDFIKDCLSDPFARVRFAAADALVRRKDPTAIPALEETGHRVTEGHLKAAAFRAAQRLGQSLDRPAELDQFKEALDKISDENRKLRDRILHLEKKVPGTFSAN